MKTLLVIFFLSVQSSYSSNTESPATEAVFDTIQFYTSGGSTWRIKTFATDQDVHIWKIGVNAEDLEKLARTNTEKHYGDVLTEAYVVHSADGLEGLRLELAERGLAGQLEEPRSGAVFWAPVGTRYRTKSQPVD